VSTFNEYQYADLVDRSKDPYAAAKYDIIARHLAGYRNLSILNAGCGSGELSFLLAAAGHRVLGIDPEPAYIDLAAARASTLGLKGCTFRVASIEAFEPPETFDCVVATDVLEHIADDRTAFDRLTNMVSAGSPVIITVPAMQMLFGFHDEALGHFRRYSRKTLRQLVEPRCAIQQIRYFGFSLIPVCVLYSKLLRRAYPVAEAGDTTKNPVLSAALRFVLSAEGRLPLPVGTSLICAGTSRAPDGPRR
jgi:2-polyprenyl-3-methyl-5-hydroxy-6-metoxy-1,4-benzoquinol methylase